MNTIAPAALAWIASVMPGFDCADHTTLRATVSELGPPTSLIYTPTVAMLHWLEGRNEDGSLQFAARLTLHDKDGDGVCHAQLVRDLRVE